MRCVKNSDHSEFLIDFHKFGSLDRDPVHHLFVRGPLIGLIRIERESRFVKRRVKNFMPDDLFSVFQFRGIGNCLTPVAQIADVDGLTVEITEAIASDQDRFVWRNRPDPVLDSEYFRFHDHSS